MDTKRLIERSESVWSVAFDVVQRAVRCVVFFRLPYNCSFCYKPLLSVDYSFNIRDWPLVSTDIDFIVCCLLWKLVLSVPFDRVSLRTAPTSTCCRLDGMISSWSFEGLTWFDNSTVFGVFNLKSRGHCFKVLMSIVIQRTGNLVTAVHLSCLVIGQQPGSLDRLFH